MYKNVLEIIGETPMLQINKIVPEGFEVFAKVEGFNPGGSIKDRVALKMINEGERNGTLNKNKTIIEATSGNTGIALAMLAAIKDYKCTVVMSEAVSVERRKLILAYGAEIVLTDKDKGTDGAILKVQEMIEESPEKYFHTNQFANMNNQLAHYEETAKEISDQVGDGIDYFVAAIGTSGTLMGVGKYLKEVSASTKIISAEPVEGHYIQGLKNMQEAIIPEIYKRELLDEIISIDSEEAFAVARRLIKEEGISVGMSSGAAMLGVLKLIERLDAPAKIVTVFPDRGEKYLSTGLFNL